MHRHECRWWNKVPHQKLYMYHSLDPTVPVQCQPAQISRFRNVISRDMFDYRSFISKNRVNALISRYLRSPQWWRNDADLTIQRHWKINKCSEQHIARILLNPCNFRSSRKLCSHCDFFLGIELSFFQWGFENRRLFESAIRNDRSYALLVLISNRRSLFISFQCDQSLRP